MLAALTLYHFAGQGIQALPVSELTTVLRTFEPPSDCNDLHQCRTIWNIIWSCLTTIFACTWIALTMNIPGQGEGPLVAVLRKVGVMGLAVIAPEVVIAWAMRQWLVARRIANEHNMSRTYGFFALMGGFVRYEGDEGPYIIYPDDLRSHLRKGDITDRAINDKSKGDVLSKGFAIIQTGWFILQCTARKIQRLPVTELEIVTLAFAILNFATYLLWWNKPLDVFDPFVVREVRGEIAGCEGDRGEHEDVGWNMFKHEVASMWRTIRTFIVQKVPGVIVSAVGIIPKIPGMITKVLRIVIGRTCNAKPWKIAMNLLAIAFFPLTVALFIAFMLGVMGSGSRDLDQKPKRVGTFYAGELTNGETKCALLVAALFATVFGLIHCIAWSFEFPTLTEQLLWRICSLAVTCVPVMLLPQILASNWLFNFLKGRGKMEALWDILYIIPLFTPGILYVFARFVLLVLAFMSLRSLPPDAYRTVHWTTFIPHI